MADKYILFGTQTGTAESCATDLSDALGEQGIEIACENVFDVKIDLLKEAKRIYIVTSTFGDGEPPEDAEDFYAALINLADGSIPGLEFAVFALGDTSYEQFCKCGRDFDEHLERIGGQRLLDRVDADIDYDDLFEAWCKKVVALETAT